MAGEERVRQAFVAQASGCETLGSPFTARLCRAAARLLSEETGVGRHVLNWPGDPRPGGDSLPLRLAGALHALVLEGKIAPLTGIEPEDRLWDACLAAFATHEDFILERLKSPPQTNEVRRSAALLPGFITIASLFSRPLVLSEVGASAGLNMQFDRYRYDLGGRIWGSDSSVQLAPQWHGEAPDYSWPEVAGRAGCDLNPLDPASADDRTRLMSYIWADQDDRLERTRNALRIAAESGLSVERADATQWLEKRLAVPFEGTAHVVYHSIAWQYLPSDAQRRGEELLSEAGTRATPDAPLARLQMEDDGNSPGAALSLQIWPSGEKRLIGRADFHGRRVNWHGWN